MKTFTSNEMEALKLKELVLAYNDFAEFLGLKSIVKFKSKEKGRIRLWDIQVKATNKYEDDQFTSVETEVETPQEGLKIEKDRPEQNGIKRPSVGGKCRAVWDYCDAIYNQNQVCPMPKEVKLKASLEGWNPNNAVIEIYQWRKFMGLSKPQK